MRVFSYRLLARHLLICAVCLLTVAQTTRPSWSNTFFELRAVANQTQGFARHAVEEVGNQPVADAGVATSLSTFDAEEPKEQQLDPVVFDEVEAGLDWSCEHQFHRRIPPRSGDDDN
jgi:hypothetical protein